LGWPVAAAAPVHPAKYDHISMYHKHNKRQQKHQKIPEHLNSQKKARALQMIAEKVLHASLFTSFFPIHYSLPT
jgi:hypothetical protein